MRRRTFIAGLGSAVAWPLAARAQQGDRVRRIGVLVPFDENEPVMKPRLSAFTQALADLGWIDGRNVRMDLRWAGGDSNRMRALARELVGLQPDIILALTRLSLLKEKIVEYQWEDPKSLHYRAVLTQVLQSMMRIAEF